ncbi:hypothetical protein F4802DRAFT_591332 [Xylaria palmicola]|nr:hypothetical protein F4802DRAFT_591332 [Xylaria palmicola]
MPGVIQEPLAGCIKWLPRKEELVPADLNIDEGCCNHPIVILSTRPVNGWVDFLTITSLGGVDLKTKYPDRVPIRLAHLPIVPSEAHPDNGVLLVLADTAHPLKKKSYVNTKNKRSIRLASLRPYHRQGPDIFLAKKSYKLLVKRIEFIELQDEPRRVEPTPPPSAPPRTSRERDLERGVDANIEFWLEYHRRSLEYSRPREPPAPSRMPGSYPVVSAPPITAASRDQRRPLLSGHDGYRPHTYGSHVTRPATHTCGVECGVGSPEPVNWKKFWTVVLKIVVAAVVLYGIYRGGCWAVALGGRVVVWAKKTAESAGEGIVSLWTSVRQALGLENPGP